MKNPKSEAAMPSSSHQAGSPTSEPLTVEQFAAKVGRGKDWVYDQIRLHRHTVGRSGVRVLPLGKPYRIPNSEALRLLEGGVR